MSGRKFCLKEQKIYKCGISLRSRLQIEARLMKLRVQESAARRVTQSHATFIDDEGKSKVRVHVIASELSEEQHVFKLADQSSDSLSVTKKL